MKNHFSGKMNKWETQDISGNVVNFEATTYVGNVYQDLMGFGELWTITKIKNKKIYLVSISNQWRPEIVTPYEDGFLYRFARQNIVENVVSDIIVKGVVNE